MIGDQTAHSIIPPMQENPNAATVEEAKRLLPFNVKGQKRYSPRELRFRDIYLVLGNATEAYIQAGYKVKNRNVASNAAHNLLKSEKMQVLLAPVLNTKNTTPSRLVELMAKRVEMEPEDEWTWNHWLKAMTLEMKRHGLLNEQSRGDMNVGTMNVLTLPSDMIKLAPDASEESKASGDAKEVIDAVVIESEGN